MENNNEKNQKRQRRSRKKTFKDPEIAIVSDDELDVVRDGLTIFYQNNPNFLKGKNIDEKIGEILDECIKGWTCAPKSFLARVQWKTKWNMKGLENRFDYKKNLHNVQQIKLQEELEKPDKNLYKGSSMSSFRKEMLPEERKIWQEREDYYRSEFEFNNSSDWSLLMQVLIEELTQIRYQKMRIKNPNQTFDMEISASNKRLIDAMKALGITRDQRESSKLETEGNIAQLAMQFEKREKEIAKLEEKFKLEEDAMMIKRQNGDIFKLLKPEIADAMKKAANEEELDLNEIIEDKKDSDNLSI